MPEPQKIPGGAEKFRQSQAYRNLVTKIPTIDTLLQEKNALIAGGSVLKALMDQPWSTDQNVSDIDIYVPIPHDKDVHTIFRSEQFRLTTHYKSSSYCASFLRRNGIRTVVNFVGQTPLSPQQPYGSRISIDIMAVRKRTTPLQVVQNFDLTFCQVWYDGRDVWATHPEHIAAKSGELQGEYVKILLAGNNFIRKRLQKYAERGFKVKANTEGMELTHELLTNLGHTTERCSYSNRPLMEEDTGISWAAKTIFRACFGYQYYAHANRYSKEEDGYDSDEYVEQPQKLIELAGTKEELARHINFYISLIEERFKYFLAEIGEDNFRRRFFDHFEMLAYNLCGTEYNAIYNIRPIIDFTNYNNYNNYDRNNNNNNYGAYNSQPTGLPEGQERPVGQKSLNPQATECFDPYMASMVDIADNQVLFYIFNKSVGDEEPTLARVACIDNETEDDGRTIQLYRQFLEKENYIYYKCKPTVPQGAIFVARNQIEPEPLRRLAFDQNVYVYERQAKQIQAGRKYALIPTENALGRIVSRDLLVTGDAVGGEHCQTNYSDKIHEIFEMVPQAGGIRLKKLRKSKKTLRSKRTKRKSNTRRR